MTRLSGEHKRCRIARLNTSTFRVAGESLPFVRNSNTAFPLLMNCDDAVGFSEARAFISGRYVLTEDVESDLARHRLSYAVGRGALVVAGVLTLDVVDGQHVAGLDLDAGW